MLRRFREFMASAPDQLTCYAFIIRVPPVEAFAEEHHGQVAIDLAVAYTGISPTENESSHRSAASPIRSWTGLSPSHGLRFSRRSTPECPRWRDPLKRDQCEC